MGTRNGHPADVPKWLRGSPAKRVSSGRAGSIPAVCVFVRWRYWARTYKVGIKSTHGGGRTLNLRLRKATRFHCATRACKQQERLLVAGLSEATVV